MEVLTMVEVDREYASKGVAGAGLGLGIAGTALGLLGNGGLPFYGLAARLEIDAGSQALLFCG